MKIVQALGWYFPDSLGGTEVYVERLSHRLMSLGHQVHVAAPDPHSTAPRHYVHNGVPVFRFPIPAQPTRGECQRIDPLPGTQHLTAWLARHQPDIVHMHTFASGMGLHEARFARSLGARVIATTHSSSLGTLCQRGTLMQWGERPCDGICQTSKCAACELQHRGLPKSIAGIIGHLPPSLGTPLGRIPGKVGTALGMSAMIRRNLHQQQDMLGTVDKFVVLTQWAADAVLANGAARDRVALNRLGIASSPQGKPRKPTEAPVHFAYVGRLDPIKGVEVLAQAIRQLPPALDLRVTFLGPCDDNGTFQRIRARIGPDPRVTFSPPVAPEAIPDFLAACDVLLCPSLCLEGGPTVALEAHAAGTPVIGSRIGGLAEFIVDQVSGRLLAPGDVEALATAITDVATHPSLVDQWRAHLPPVRTVDQIADDYLKLYAA